MDIAAQHKVGEVLRKDLVEIHTEKEVDIKQLKVVRQSSSKTRLTTCSFT